MDLTPHVEQIRGQLAVAAEAGGEDARALAERLTAPLESAIRLTLLDALSAAADEITPQLAPGSVEPRLRAGAPRRPPLAALPAAADETPREPAPGWVGLRLGAGAPDFVAPAPAPGGRVEPLEPAAEPAAAAPDPDEPATARINLRLAEALKA